MVSMIQGLTILLPLNDEEKTLEEIHLRKYYFSLRLKIKNDT